MPKSKRNSRKNIYRKTKSRKNKSRSKSLEGYTISKSSVNCCMCENKSNRTDTLVPLNCLRKYGERAHRICQNCWWKPTTGFAVENGSHECPGCKKHYPLTIPLKKSKPTSEEIIIISDDD
jgi:hypothetical protein